MKESKLLKTICYILVPFLIIGIIFPLYYYYNNKDVEHINVYNYFHSQDFSYNYMNDLEYAKRNIVNVMYSEDCNNLTDGDKIITYLNNEPDFKESYFSSKARDFIFVITYGNRVWTNITLTSDTDTYEKLMKVLEENRSNGSNFVNIENETINSDVDVINLFGIQSINTYKNTKYKVYKYLLENRFREEVLEKYNIDLSEYNNDVYIMQEKIDPLEEAQIVYSKNNSVVNDLIQVLKEDYPNANIYEDSENERIVFEYDSSKFNVYSTFIPKYKSEEILNVFSNFLEMVKPYENLIFIVCPMCVIGLILIIIYLIISIGHEKGKNKVELNDLDKIPFDLILIIDCILCLPLIVLLERDFFCEKVELFFILIISSYFIYYIIIAININTFIKRIKAKSFWKTTIIGKVILIVLKYAKKVLKYIKTIFEKIFKVINKFLNSKTIVTRIFLYTLVFFIISIGFLVILGPIGACIDLGLLIYIIYCFTMYCIEYEQIEKHLKKMYDGEVVQKLEPDKFQKVFRNIIEYINNIQNGYKNAIEEGIKSEKLKTELITNVSHDIKTPLTSIINYIDLLKNEKIENKKANEYLNILESKSQRLKKLTEDLVEASKASSGNISLNIEKINVKELLKQSIGEFEDKFKERKLSIENTYPDEDIFINADNKYIYRIIENLFSNISKYALKGTRVYIDLECENEKVQISIKNISKDKLNISEEELMQRFVRGDKSRTTEGSGLGLSITQSLTELQKGTFKIKIDGDLFKVILSFDEAK